MYKLGVMVIDKVTGATGMLTHFQVEGRSQMYYYFQPRGLNPKDGQPVESFWIDPDRVLNGTEVPEPYLGRDIMGTEVRDQASGFKGIAVSTILHINGCLHIDVQPSTINTQTGGRVKRHDFDIRRLVGHVIPPITEVEREASHQATPSPAPMQRLRD